jgi:sirohydrochlorin cobaltochelatase
MTSSNRLLGIILFAHGSRDPLWHKPMLAVAQCMAEQEPDSLVRCAYLELTTPDLASCADELVALGMQALRIVPMFLGVGKHAREDLPILVKNLQERYPGIVIELRAPVGEHPQLIQQLAQIALSKA